MFKRSDVWAALGAVAALVLCGAAYEAAAGEIDAERAREAPLRKAVPVPILRCWQEGRLLFEEPLSAVPPELRRNARIAATDRQGRALTVIDMASTTCLVRNNDEPAQR
jgi:hypothetical protein